MIQVDYLVVGAGAMGMAFTDVLLQESGASVAIVDRYECPGGHWTRAYPFVRLHQPSAFYGVNSRPLGSGEKDSLGWNAGLFELASGAEVVAYFDQVMNRQFLPSERVQYFPMSDFAEGDVIVSLVSGGKQKVRARTIVDATYSRVEVPSMRKAPYEVAEGATCVPPNALATIDAQPGSYVVIGAGKTGIDSCLWLLARGVAADVITWIMPRDSWYLDRETIQPGPDFFASTVGGFALQMEAAATAASVDELFELLEGSGQLLRLDKNVKPTMYRCATVSRAELEQLRSMKNVVRMGRVQAITSQEIVLDHGSIAAEPNTLFIDCTADGLKQRPAVPVFDDARITIQNVRTCQPTFSSALIGHVEATYADVSVKNDICTPIPYPDSALDWLEVTRQNAINTARWNEDAGLGTWMRNSRLDAYSLARPGDVPSGSELAILQRVGKYAPRAAENLTSLLHSVGPA